MTAAALRIALSASVLMIAAGAASSAESPSATVLASAGTAACTPAQMQAATRMLYTTGPNARHANTSRVRYTAKHAMPAAQPVKLAAGGTGCSLAASPGATALD